MAKGQGLTLKALLRLETAEFKAGINKVKKQLNGLANTFKSAFALGSVAAFGKQVIQVSADFEDAMARVKAITNASQKDFENMRKEAAKMGKTTRYTASQAAGALENLTRNGMTASQATKALSGVMQLAQANAIDLARSADIVTNVLNMFGLSVAEVGRVNDVLSSTAANAATDIDNLYEALVNASPAAKTLGFTVEETSAAIGALAQRGVKGSDAGTQLRMALTKMADPKIIAKMQAMGVAIDEQSMKSEGLLGTINRLRKAELSLTDLVGIFSQRGAVGMQQLINSYEDFNRLLEVTKNSAGTTARMFEEGVGSTRKEIDNLKSMYEGLLISIGDKTSGVVNTSVKGLQNLVNNFNSVTGTLLNIASVVVPLLLRKIMVLGRTAGTTLGAIKLGLSGIKAAMGGWVTIIATVVTWIGTALYGAWAKVNQPLKDANKNMREVEASTETMRKNANSLISQLGPDTDKTTLAGIVKKLTEMFPDFADEINNAARIAAQTGNWEKLKGVLSDIVELQALSATRDAKQQLHDAQVKWLGNTLYTQGKRPGWNTYTPGLVGPGANKSVRQSSEIYDSLYKQLGKDGKELIKKIFDTIADIMTDVGDDVTKGGKIKKLLDDYGVKISQEEAEAYVANTRDIVGLRPSTRDNVAKALQSGKEVHSADSTLAVKTIDHAIDAFESLRDELKDRLDKKDADAANQMSNQADKLKQVLLDNYKYATDEQKKFVETVSAIYKQNKSNTTGGSGGSGGGGGSTAKTVTDLLTDELTGYTKSAKELKNQLDAGALSQKEYEDAIGDLVDKTFKAITAFDDWKDVLTKLPEDLQATATAIGKTFAENVAKGVKAQTDKEIEKLKKYVAKQVTKYAPKEAYNPSDYERKKGQTFSNAQKKAMEKSLDETVDYIDSLQDMIDDLQEGIDNGDFDLVKDAALKRMKDMQTELGKAKNEAEAFQQVLTFAEAEEQIIEMQEQLSAMTIDAVEGAVRGFGQVTDALYDIFELFDEDVRDSEFYKGLEATLTVMESFLTIFEAISAAIKAVGAVTEMTAAIKKKAAAQEVAANMAVAASEGTKAAAAAGAAAAGAASSVAGTPIVGPILAVAAVGAVVAAIIAAMSKFATGGIIGGDSPTGDKHFARVNSGEMILNKGQQATLFNAIQSGNLGGGNARFVVRGCDLVAVLENEKSRRRG